MTKSHNYQITITRLLILLVLLLAFCSSTQAKLYNSIWQNNKYYGKELYRQTFSDPGKPFTGYVTHKVNRDRNFVIKAYYIDGKARSEHLIPANPSKPKFLSRAQVRDWSGRMFLSGNRGRLRKQMTKPYILAFFFDRGLITYEYGNIKNKAKGFKTVKVLIYDSNKKFYQVRQKAYI